MFLFFTSCGNNSGYVPGSQQSSPTVPATHTTGAVILRIGAVPRRANDTLTVIVENQTNQVIQFADHLTNCTVIRLERNVPPPPGDGQWEMIGPCLLTTATQLHSLPPGQRMEVALVPPVQHWVPGIYRAALSYRMAGAPSAGTTIFSSRFQMDF